MQVLILGIGKTSESYLQEGEIKYIQRLKHYCQLDTMYLTLSTKMSNLEPAKLKKEEARALLDKINTGDKVILLDEKGVQLSSMGMATTLQKWFNSAPKRLVFMIGGAYGFDESIYSRADYQLSLSAMTFTHQMIRILFLEQLYRAFTILKNEPYHNI
jgi:23S rRNA (pseudouridine1915-N3)-methyltransferase